MEHLTHQPTEKAFRLEVRAVGKALESGDWSGVTLNEHDIGEARYPWLGHDHETSSWHHHPELERRQAPDSEALPRRYGVGWNAALAMFPGELDLRSVHPSLQNIRTDGKVVRRVAAFVQSWMFLSSLEELCERPVATSAFVCGGWVCTRNLPAFLDAWWKKLAASSDSTEEVESTLMYAKSCVSHTRSALGNLYESADAEGGMRSELVECLAPVEPALTALFEALIGYIDSRLGSIGSGVIGGRYYRSAFASTEHLSRLVRRGWCPCYIARVQESPAKTFLRFVDAVGWVPRGTAAEHAACNDQKCKRHNIDVDTYYQRHRTARCRCRFAKPDLERVFEVLDEDKVPVVRLSPDGQDFEVGAAACAGKAGLQYVAFSHVWADGLGSTTERGLPGCQAERLQLLINRAGVKFPGSWFWIDGLCIPKQEHYRRKAIGLISTTFENAAATFVLDSGLEGMSVESASPIELGWSIFASGWMGRMWTYLEAVVSGSVYIVLSDHDLLKLSDFVELLFHIYFRTGDSPYGRQNPFPSILIHGFLGPLYRIGQLRPEYSKVLKSSGLDDVWSALATRQTSRADDQVLVIASFLGLDVQPLMEISGEDRMKALYVRLREIPWSILFDPRPKIRSATFRWAPRSWLYDDRGHAAMNPDPNKLAICTEKGLRVRLTALKLNGACDATETEAVLIVGDKEYILIRKSRSGSSRDPSSPPEPTLSRFNVVVVNYYLGNSHPKEFIEQQMPAAVKAGVVFVASGSRRGSKAEHDFSTGFRLQELGEEDNLEELRRHVPTLTGTWEEVDILLT